MDKSQGVGASALQTGLSPTAEPVPVSSAVAASIPCAAVIEECAKALAVFASYERPRPWDEREQWSRNYFLNAAQVVFETAIATEARRAETAQTGSVHDGAAPQEIAR